MPKLSTDFEETFSCAHQNFEEQNKVLEPSIIFIILHNMETLVGHKKQKIGIEVNAMHEGNLSACHFGHMCIGSLALP